MTSRPGPPSSQSGPGLAAPAVAPMPSVDQPVVPTSAAEPVAAAPPLPPVNQPAAPPSAAEPVAAASTVKLIRIVAAGEPVVSRAPVQDIRRADVVNRRCGDAVVTQTAPEDQHADCEASRQTIVSGPAVGAERGHVPAARHQPITHVP